MKYETKLNEFNQHLANELISFFPKNIQPFQSEREVLLFRGPISNLSDKTHIGTHVSVELDAEVKESLESASPERRSEIIELLVCNLAAQIKAKYDCANVGQYAEQFKGTMKTITG